MKKWTHDQRLWTGPICLTWALKVMGWSLSPHLPWRPPYLAKVPGLILDAVSRAQEDEAILVQQVLPALSFIPQEYSILWREAGRDEGLWGARLSLQGVKFPFEFRRAPSSSMVRLDWVPDNLWKSLTHLPDGQCQYVTPGQTDTLPL